MDNCVCGSFLRREKNAAASVVMDASFVHLPPSLLVDSSSSSSSHEDNKASRRIHPLHTEYLESLVAGNENNDTAPTRSAAALCLHCVQR